MAIRKQLSGTDGYQFFEEKIRNSKIPTFYGRVVSSSPEDNPETLMVAMSGSSNSEIRLNLNPRTENSVPSGSQIAFEGVAVGFTQEPFLLTLNVTAIRSSGGARNSL